MLTKQRISCCVDVCYYKKNVHSLIILYVITTRTTYELICQFITPSQKHHFIYNKKSHNKVGRYKRLTRSCKSNDRLYNDKKKDTWTINNLRNTTQKTNYGAILTPLNTVVYSGGPDR